MKSIMKSVGKKTVVLITGASRGIGRAVALAYTRRGARIVLAARSAEGLASVEAAIASLGGEALSIRTDVTSDESVNTLVSSIVEKFGRIDVLVNNAGIGTVGEISSPQFASDVRQTLEASLFGMIRVTQGVLPLMRRQGSGTIVNMSSVMGRKAFARFGAYAIVKHAVSAFSDALRQELADSSIRVSVIYPGLTATDLLRDVAESDMPTPFRYTTPLTPESVAKAILTAVDKGSARVVLPAQANMLLLGEAVSPRIGDAIARALTIRPVARLLGLSRGQTYHQAIGLTADPQAHGGGNAGKASSVSPSHHQIGKC